MGQPGARVRMHMHGGACSSMPCPHLEVRHRLVVEHEALELHDEGRGQRAEADALLRGHLLARVELVHVLACMHAEIQPRCR